MDRIQEIIIQRHRKVKGMHLSLICPTLNRIDECHKMIDSALAGNKKPDSIVIIDNSCGRFKLELETPPNAVLTPEYNLGVAVSWNVGIDFARKQYGANVVLVCNDDVLFYDDTLEELLEYAAIATEADIVYPGGVNRDGNVMNAFSLFLTTPDFILDEMHGFDVGFKRAYFEDNDMKYRMDLEGYMLGIAPCSYDHIGSATLHALTIEHQIEHHNTFNHNQARYIAKWGGLPHHEKFKTPFNGELSSKEWHKPKDI